MIVQGCLQCQAATETKHRDPLIPSKAPSQVWTHLDADHWGPTDEGKYILVVVDETSKYADAVVVNSTSAEPNIEAFDRMFSTHGYPEKLKTDGAGDHHSMARKTTSYRSTSNGQVANTKQQ